MDMKMKVYRTVYKENIEEHTEGELVFSPDQGEENQLVNLYPQMSYQTFEGFGGAITESAGYVFSKMDKEKQDAMLEEYFGRENMKYRMVRIPIDSCDFSLGHYEAVTDQMDRTFAGFQLERVEKNIFPLLDRAQRVYGEALEIMLTPWSPPAYMKTNGQREHGGGLKEAYKGVWAEYICRYIKEYRKCGYKVKRMSLQNEPKAVQTWDSCVYNAQEEKEFLRDHMWPALQENHLEDVEIFIWDHNKERAFERACAIIDETTSPMIAGIAFHWYSGDHFDALAMIHEKFPDKKLILSEACIEYSKFSAGDYLKNAQKYAHDIIGNLNHGMTGFYDWNLVLDEEGGPNHVKNFCDAPFLYDTKNEKLLKRNTARYLWHFSHFIERGAVRIGTTSYTEKIEVTAFRNRDGSITAVLLNRTEKELTAKLRITDRLAAVKLPPASITTVSVSF